MTALTDLYDFLKPTGSDPVADGDDTIRTALDRIDYMLGETGDNTITPSAANTKTTKVINFARTYKTPPRCMVSLGRDAFVGNVTAGALSIWVDDVSTTQITIAVNRQTTSVTEFTWTARPNPTDVTP